MPVYIIRLLYYSQQRQLCLYKWRKINGDNQLFQPLNIVQSGSGNWTGRYLQLKCLVLDILLAIFARLQSAKAKRIGLETPQSLSRSPILEYNIGFIRIHISQYIEK